MEILYLHTHDDVRLELTHQLSFMLLWSSLTASFRTLQFQFQVSQRSCY